MVNGAAVEDNCWQAAATAAAVADSDAEQTDATGKWIEPEVTTATGIEVPVEADDESGASDCSWWSIEEAVKAVESFTVLMMVAGWPIEYDTALSNRVPGELSSKWSVSCFTFASFPTLVVQKRPKHTDRFLSVLETSGLSGEEWILKEKKGKRKRCESIYGAELRDKNSTKLEVQCEWRRCWDTQEPRIKHKKNTQKRNDELTNVEIVRSIVSKISEMSCIPSNKRNKSEIMISFESYKSKPKVITC